MNGKIYLFKAPSSGGNRNFSISCLKTPLLMIRHEIAIDICISRKRHVKNVDKCPFIHFKYAKSSIMIHLEIFTESILLS